MRKNGPYKVTGPVTMIDAEGNEFDLPEGDGMVLCRCGASTTKPFCDKTHSKIGFEAAESAVRGQVAWGSRAPRRRSSTRRSSASGAGGRPEPPSGWWPDVLEIECTDLKEGCRYRGVTKGPIGVAAHDLVIDRFEDCREVSIFCEGTGVTTRFVLAEAQGGTFVEGCFTIEPNSIGIKVLAAVTGRRFMPMDGELA